jgi:hypothetical protein
MNMLQQNRLQSQSPIPSEDALDQLLCSFFQQQLPASWPAFKPPADPAAVGSRSPHRYLLSRSRFVLAASVVFLFVGQLGVSSFFSNQTAPVNGRGFSRNEATNRTGPPRLKPLKPLPRIPNAGEVR